MENKHVDILGTRYRIEFRKVSEDKILSDNGYMGYCCDDEPLIVIADVYDDCTQKEKDSIIKVVLRHEITHAFLNESGLQTCSNKYGGGWAKNEEMVDWIALQFPKMQRAFLEVGCNE